MSHKWYARELNWFQNEWDSSRRVPKMWPTVHKGLLKRRGRPRFSKSASPWDGRTQLYHARVGSCLQNPGCIRIQGIARYSNQAGSHSPESLQLGHIAGFSHAPLEGYSVPPSGLFWAKLSGFGPDFAQKSGFFIKIMKVRLVCID